MNSMLKIACVVSLLTPLRAIAQSSLAGTYEIAVCKVLPCTPGDTAHAAAWGRLILFAQPIDMSTVPDSARRLLDVRYFRAPINACVILHRVPDAQTYAGGIRGTHWSTDSTASDGIHVMLYRSPDAFHDVVAHVNGSELRGTGESRGAGVAEVHWPADTIVGHRIGPPDLEACISASLAEWRRIRTPRTRP